MKRRMRPPEEHKEEKAQGAGRVSMYVYIMCDIFSRWCNFKGRFDTIITFVLVLNSGSIKLRRKCCNNFSLYAILCCNYVCHVWGGQRQQRGLLAILLAMCEREREHRVGLAQRHNGYGDVVCVA